MKKIISVFFVMALFISCSHKIYNSSSWQKNKITVDGYIPEWPNPLRFYDQESGINYSISNDLQNLYFCCSVSNDFLQTKILRSGLEFGIDTIGKKSFSVSIKYPFNNASDTDPRNNIAPQSGTGSTNGERAPRSSFKLKLIAEANEILLTGFKPYLGKFVSLSVLNTTGISAAIKIDDRGIMNYEAVIPFSTFYKKELTASDSSRVFNFQIKVNQLANSGNGSSGGNRGGGMRGGGMGSGMGMGMGGGMGGGMGMRGGGMGMRGGGMGMRGNSGDNSSQRNAASGTTKISIKLKLAYKS